MPRGGFGFTHEHMSGDYEWYTPARIFDGLGLEFDLDPCAPPLPGAAWIPARRRYSLPENGLELPWEGRVWLNPPYARETAPWLGKLCEHGNGVALVFARTDTAWGQLALRKADAVCFVAGRVNFVPARPRKASNRTNSNAGAPSMLLAYGPECAEAVSTCGLGVTLGAAAEAHQMEIA